MPSGNCTSSGSLAGPGGTFVEHDLDDDGRLVPVERAEGTNRAGVVVGVVSSPSERHPEGMTRVAVLGDPTKALGSLASLQIGVSGRNLLTVTNYSGIDPAVSNFGNQPIGRNYDVGPYPPSRSFWLSITAGM